MVYCAYDSPLGRMMMCGEADRLCWLGFADQRYAPAVGDRLSENGVEPFSVVTRNWLDLYFSGGQPDFLPQLDFSFSATPFRRAVWQMLRQVSFGATVSYGELARSLSPVVGHQVSARAVGNAVGHNPITIIVPCHRVVGVDGALTGYAAGVWRKEILLRFEAEGCWPEMQGKG